MTDKLREAALWKLLTEAREALWQPANPDLCGRIDEALAQQDAQAVPTQRQYEMALRQWDHWKSYALELQAKLVKYEGGSPMVLNAAPEAKNHG